MELVHHFGGGVYAKETRIPNGEVLLQHSHAFDHLSILASGQVVVSTPSEQKLYYAPECITIKAGIRHQVQALTDAVWYCIHATPETDPAKADASVIGDY